MSGFFAELPVLVQPDGSFDAVHYRPAPGNWAVVVTDVVGSTQAIAAGRHKAVNFVAAMAIAALKNLCAPRPIPFLFGGDGAVVMVPPEHVAEARAVLARVRGAASRDYGLALRVGLLTVDDLRGAGAEVQVARYEPSPGNSFGVFLGGGVSVLEAAVKGRGDAGLAARAAVDEALDDRRTVDLSGLSCRWDLMQSRNGQVVALIVVGAPRPLEVYTTVMRIAGQERDPRAVRLDNMMARWPPTGFMLEARAQRRSGSLAASVVKVLAMTLLARIVMVVGRPVGRFDPQRYRRSVVANTDFCKYDDTLCFVFDCPADSTTAIRRYLDSCVAEQKLSYGMDVSETALMTCLVTSVEDDLHVHFVDGGGGGYTNAARHLKASARRGRDEGAAPH